MAPDQPAAAMTGLSRCAEDSANTCTIPDCVKPARGSLCSMHEARIRRHGDPDYCLHQRDRNIPRGPDSPLWTGDAATEDAMHQRVRRAKGRAADHACVDCGGQAAQWSYDHLDTDERPGIKGPYSLGLDHYVPRCVRCHKRFDLPYVRGRSRQAGPVIDPDAVRRLHAAGVSVREMSRIFGASHYRLSVILDELGLPRFPVGRR